MVHTRMASLNEPCSSMTVLCDVLIFGTVKQLRKIAWNFIGGIILDRQILNLISCINFHYNLPNPRFYQNPLVVSVKKHELSTVTTVIFKLLFSGI